MALNAIKNSLAYGFNNALQNLSPLPIVAKRVPSSTDVAEIGTYWIYDNEVWMFTSSANWTQLAAAGNEGTFTELTVNGISALNGALTVASGTGAINISADAAATTVNLATGAGVKALTIGSTHTSSATTINSGTGGLVLNSNGTGNILITADNVLGSSYTFTQNVRVGSQSIAIISNITVSASIVITMTNSFLASLSTPVLCTVTSSTSGTAGGYLQVNGIINGLGGETLTIYCTNVGTQTISGGVSNVIVTFMILE
jgi:hypothetical protein